MNLPADLHGRAGVLVIGFSKKSSAQTKQWNDVLLPQYGNDPHVVYYQCAVLADVPGLVRGMVIKGIRGSMSAAERAHFIPILQDASKWKEAARYSASDDAYVLIFDKGGQIQWRDHGAPTGEGRRQLKEHLADLEKIGN